MTSTNKNSIPDTQCLKIKYIFICSMKKQMMFYSSKLRKTEKQLSQTWEERKTEENGRPNIGKTEKQRKMTFPNLGKSKNSGNRPSQHWENQKTPQAAFSTPWKAKKRRKSFVACERNAEIAKSSVSLASDERKTLKTAFRS
ncbi:hypothetical protein HMPREF2983_00165 [Prevotella sp. HMSC077E09]|nr:hypothetical protein HMPREF3018_07935 [Prevotella sp. HMSC077E08]OFP48901.1 hypothetical protein HMPREF2983_00165 [Prevotella sp. HMSC077E09]